VLRRLCYNDTITSTPPFTFSLQEYFISGQPERELGHNFTVKQNCRACGTIRNRHRTDV